MELINIFKKNNGKRSPFKEILFVDYYDGPTEAFCMIDESGQWLIARVYFNPDEHQRIFMLLETSKEFMSELRPFIDLFNKGDLQGYNILKDKIIACYKHYSGRAFLFMASSIYEINYDIVQLENNELHYFKEIEDVLEQDEKSKLKWLGFFNKF